MTETRVAQLYRRRRALFVPTYGRLPVYNDWTAVAPVGTRIARKGPRR